MNTRKAAVKGHHISSHFTNGLFPVSSVLLTCFLFTKNPNFEASSFYCMLFGATASPITYATGLYDWRTRFKGRRTSIFNRKIIFGFLFFFGSLTEITLRFSVDQIMFEESLLNISYVLLNYILTIFVIYLGYLGGKFLNV